MLALFSVVMKACFLVEWSIVTAGCQGFVSTGQLMKRVLGLPCLAVWIRFDLTDPHFDKILRKGEKKEAVS